MITGQSATNWWSCEQFGHNQGANDLMTELFGTKNIFSNPKPIELLRGLIQISNAKKHDFILDFFAGSGTSAHSVLEFNAKELNSNLKFITVQIPEPTFTINPKNNQEIAKKGNEEAFKAGYKTIFDITKARIEKAATKIKKDNPHYQGDVGFKIFEVFPIFDKYQDDPQVLTPNLELFDASTLSSQDRQNLLLTWTVRDKIELGTKLMPINLAGYTAYSVKHLLYFIDPNMTLDTLIAVFERIDNDPKFVPQKLVVLGYLLESKAHREISEAIKHLINRKGIELTLDVRYN